MAEDFWTRKLGNVPVDLLHSIYFEVIMYIHCCLMTKLYAATVVPQVPNHNYSLIIDLLPVHRLVMNKAISGYLYLKNV